MEIFCWNRDTKDRELLYDLLMLGGEEAYGRTQDGSLLSSSTTNSIVEIGVAKKWKSYIEKVP